MRKGGSNLIGNSFRLHRYVEIRLSHLPCSEQKGRFLNVIFDHIKLRKLDPSEDTATKRPCWVYYTCHVSIRIWVAGHVYPIIPYGVGWLSCLSRWKGNAKA